MKLPSFNRCDMLSKLITSSPSPSSVNLILAVVRLEHPSMDETTFISIDSIWRSHVGTRIPRMEGLSSGTEPDGVLSRFDASDHDELSCRMQSLIQLSWMQPIIMSEGDDEGGTTDTIDFGLTRTAVNGVASS